MSQMFSTILNMSLTASYAALIIIVVRLVLNFIRVPKILSYVLWLVVLVRLICPISIESAISLVPQTNNEIINTQSLFLDITQDKTEVLSDNNAEQLEIKESVIDSRPFYQIALMNSLPFIWIIGMIGLLAYGILSFIKVKRKVFAATLIKENIFETDRIFAPFVFGIINPKIYLPINLCQSKLDYIIKHEQVHIKRKDHLIRLVAAIILAIHWFNPIIWISYFMMINDMEMSCDERVLKEHKEDIRNIYSNTLLSFASNQIVYLKPLSFGENNVRARIKNILRYKKPTIWFIIIVSIILSGIAIGLLMNPTKQIVQDDPTPETIETNNENTIEETDPILAEIKTILTDFELPDIDNGYNINPITKEVESISYHENSEPPKPVGTQSLAHFKTLVLCELTEHYSVLVSTYPVKELPDIDDEDRETMEYYMNYYKENPDHERDIGPWYCMIYDTKANIAYIERVEEGLKDYPVLYDWVQEAKSHYLKVTTYDIEEWEEAYKEYVEAGEMFNNLEKVLNE